LETQIFILKGEPAVTIDRTKTCSFTGHRVIPDEITGYLTKRVKDGVDYLYSQGIKTFLTGGAIGFDTLAAKAVIECREAHEDIRLILVIPCRDQTRTWKQADVDAYERIMKHANEVICLSEHYYNGCMHTRNRYLVNNSNTCICYLTRENGGTAYTVRYAKSSGLTVFNLAQRKHAPIDSTTR